MVHLSIFQQPKKGPGPKQPAEHKAHKATWRLQFVAPIHRALLRSPPPAAGRRQPPSALVAPCLPRPYSLRLSSGRSRIEVDRRQSNRQRNAKPFESMETSAATPTRPPNPAPAAASPSPSPSSSLRHWRSAAQRNVRNQWSHLKTAKDKWLAAAADGRTHASALVNTHLSRR